jgi:hypothetical protein
MGGRNIRTPETASLSRGMKHMTKELFAYSAAAMLALGLAGALIHGGSATGSLAGEVTDPSGAVVPNAKIFVLGDRWSKTLSTDGAGRYEVDELAPGTYEVSVSSDGFAPLDRAGLVVSAGVLARMDAPLNLAVLQQAVTVTAQDSDRYVGP